MERDGPRRGQARARALNAAAVLARAQGDYAAARPLFGESLAIFRELGDRRGIVNALHNLGSVSRFQGNYAGAARLFDEGLALWRELGDTWGIGVALAMRGALALDLGDYERAGPLLEESLALGRKLGDTWTVAGRLGMLAELAREQGQYQRARTLVGEALSLGRELGDRESRAWLLAKLERVACKQGDYEQAIALCRESLPVFREVGESWGIAVCLETLGGVAGATGQPDHATRLSGAAGMIREVIGFPISSDAQGLHRASHERNLAPVRSKLAEGRSHELGRKDGQCPWGKPSSSPWRRSTPPALRTTHPIDRRLSMDPLHSRHASARSPPCSRGLTNRQIAEALVTSERTASTHVTDILGKLGFATRAQVAAWAVELGLANHS